MDIYTPAIPKIFRITDTMLEDFIYCPAMAAKILLGENHDAFQQSAITIGSLTPFVMDSSGWSSSKTMRMSNIATLRSLLIDAHHSMVCYPTFSTGQKSFWNYFQRYASQSAFFRAHMGKYKIPGLDSQVAGEKKAESKGPSAWEFSFKNGSVIMLPAVGFQQDAKSLASLRIHDLFIDEHTKAESSGSKGIDDQLVGRATEDCFNQNHPWWCNHQYFAATAEDTMHPSYARYKNFLDEVRKGNPDYFLLSYCYKDYSDLPYLKREIDVPGQGKKIIVTTFKEKYRNEKNIHAMRLNKSKAGFRQEGLGIWSTNGKGLYTDDLIDACIRNGTERGIWPMTSRMEDWERDKEKLKTIHYFLGGDPAKADKKKADDGALITLRVCPRKENPTRNITDWQIDFVWAYLVRGADAPQWSAIMHRKHRQFDYSGIELDGGPGGGGNWIRPELAKRVQIIRDREVKVRPIACEEDESTLTTADFILSMFKMGDAKIAKLWGEEHHLRGDDTLIDLAHTEFLQAMEAGSIGFPKPPNEWPKDEFNRWSEERQWACRLLNKGARQLAKINVKTEDDGTTYYNTHGSREFSAKGKKDFAYAMVYAFTRFLMWVKAFDEEEGSNLKPEEAGLAY